MNALVLSVGIVLLHFCGCDDQVVEEFDCSSYFSRVLTKRHLGSGIAEKAKTSCPRGMRYRMTGFKWNGTTCKVEFTLDSNVNIMQKDKVCYDSFLYMRKNALSEAWGTPWVVFAAQLTVKVPSECRPQSPSLTAMEFHLLSLNYSGNQVAATKSRIFLFSGCKETFVKTQITPFYSIKRHVPSIQTIEDSATVSAACKYPLLSPDQRFEVKCEMNRYGGYEWRENERSGCYMEEFETYDEKAFALTTTQLKGPVKCSVLYLLVFGRLKHLITEEKDPYKFLAQSYSTLESWSKHCLQLDPIFNQFFLTGFLRLTELMLNAVVQKAHFYALNGIKLYKLIHKLTEIINAHVINGTAATFYSHLTDLISIYRYPPSMASIAKLSSIDKVSFYVEEMENPVPLDVTCYAIAVHHAYIQVISLRPISHLCFVGSFSLRSLVKILLSGVQIPPKQVRKSVPFANLICITTLSQSSFLRFYPDFRNFGIVHLLVNLMFIDCLSACLDQCQNAHFCLSKGPILLAWSYMQTVLSIPYWLAVVLTGKTNQLGRMLWNLAIICAIVCVTVQAVLQYYGNHFLNHICMPLDPTNFIITVKIVVVLVNLFIFTHYLRMRYHRYFDECIGCMIYTLGDIFDVIFGIIMMANYWTGADNEQATFIFQHTVNRTLMTLFSTIYQVFFKMSLMKFYYRVYLITVHHATLRDIVQYENHHRIFQIINTFSEHDGTKVSQFYQLKPSSCHQVKLFITFA
ncbi:unnamed protein product [Hydatigera taeniaeformis]|uniref:GpcrRhopsn4 domain-containing protein n=1 Tax=Hydatigena taeniaeformis TaxID=6205 RepID=A0A0R3X085_HYDTA|nr:unnamed protein product [Hydatigera taeniaeformis]